MTIEEAKKRLEEIRSKENEFKARIEELREQAQELYNQARKEEEKRKDYKIEEKEFDIVEYIITHTKRTEIWDIWWEETEDDFDFFVQPRLKEYEEFYNDLLSNNGVYFDNKNHAIRLDNFLLKAIGLEDWQEYKYHFDFFKWLKEREYDYNHNEDGVELKVEWLGNGEVKVEIKE